MTTRNIVIPGVCENVTKSYQELLANGTSLEECEFFIGLGEQRGVFNHKNQIMEFQWPQSSVPGVPSNSVARQAFAAPMDAFDAPVVGLVSAVPHQAFDVPMDSFDTSVPHQAFDAPMDAFVSPVLVVPSESEPHQTYMRKAIYWNYLSDYPCHGEFPPQAESEALKVLHLAYARKSFQYFERCDIHLYWDPDNLTARPGVVRTPFSKQELPQFIDFFKFSDTLQNMEEDPVPKRIIISYVMYNFCMLSWSLYFACHLITSLHRLP